MGNFIGLVYATLNSKGIDTNKLSTKEAIEKYNQLQGKSIKNVLEHNGIDTKNMSSQEMQEAYEKIGGDKNWAKKAYETKPNKKEQIEKAKKLIKSNKLPDGVEYLEYLGGTMDIDGNAIDMKELKDGYLISCGNDSYEENRKYLMESDFIERFMEHSDNGILYVGTWCSKGEAGNEPTIWIKDRKKAEKLAHKLGQWSITDCAVYNKYGCENYKLLTDEQDIHQIEIFIPTIKNDEEHKIKLKDIDL